MMYEDATHTEKCVDGSHTHDMQHYFYDNGYLAHRCTNCSLSINNDWFVLGHADDEMDMAATVSVMER
jgi:hypothetical protein